MSKRKINDFINIVPSLTKKLTEFISKMITIFEPILGNNTASVKQEVFSSIVQIGKDITVGLPDKVVSIVTSIISGFGTFLLGLFIGLYMLFDFDNVSKVCKKDSGTNFDVLG